MKFEIQKLSSHDYNGITDSEGSDSKAKLKRPRKLRRVKLMTKLKQSMMRNKPERSLRQKDEI